MISDEDFAAACELAYGELLERAPFDTGNLALNAIKIEFPSPQECRIYVDQEIAPYMPYTNEPWIAERWHGAKNPNEGWWNDACEYLINLIADLLGGEIKKT